MSLLNFYIFSIYLSKKVTFSSGLSHGHSNRNIKLVLFFCSILIEKNLQLRVPGQRRVAMTGGNVPDFDGLVFAAAGDKLAVRRKSDGVDTVIETSERMKHR